MKDLQKTRDRAAFGDFQTPVELARDVAAFVAREEPAIQTVVEPTCGLGSFLRAAVELFGKTPLYFGFDVNGDYLESAQRSLDAEPEFTGKLAQEDFYQKDWKAFFTSQPVPILVIGNPPWVTNAAMGAMGANNLPQKTNFQRHSGFAAKTGKANFDISEWMLIKLIEALQGKPSVIAMLCKTATARKVLRHAWLNGLHVGPSSLHLINANLHFGVSVDACLLYTHTNSGEVEATATVYPDLSFDRPAQTFGLLGGELVSDIDAYRTFREIDGLEYRKWRSGVKHDAAKVMEFRRVGTEFVNGLHEKYLLESDFLYPLLKSSDLANGRLTPSRFVLLTQQRVGDDTEKLQQTAPRVWQYLLDHAEQLDTRGSSIYAKRSRFSVFGIGDYTFAPWKVAVSGLYKNIKFRPVGPFEGKPAVFDDTCYFIPCRSEREAAFFAKILSSEPATKFISSLVFSDAKRPVTIDVLKRIDLKKLAESLGEEGTAIEFLSSSALETTRQRLLVFESAAEYGTNARRGRKRG